VEEKIEALTEDVVKAIEEKKGESPLVIDVRGRCAVTDRFILASGRNSRQLKAMARAVAAAAHHHGLSAHIEGMEAAEWLLIDLGDVVVHLFLPDVREAFQLERLWAAPSSGEAAGAERR
jgi:ribosome-associated protein